MSDSARDNALEEAARYIEGFSVDEVLGLMARRKRDREDAALRSRVIRETRQQCADEIRHIKTIRKTDAVAVLAELASLNGSDRHDLYLMRAWPLAWRGWINIEAITTVNSNVVPPPCRYRIMLTDKGRAALAENPGPASNGDDAAPQHKGS